MLDNIDEERFSKKNKNSCVMRLDCRNISASLLNSTQRNAKQDIPWEQKPLYDDV
jgi:beta-lactamase superfamily II metal-dependent hydrolase